MNRLLLTALLLGLVPAAAAQTAQPLPFTQDWSNTGLITANDNWGGVPGVVGYLGTVAANTTDIDPRTILEDRSGAIDVIANQTNPNTNTAGGVAEFELANPVVALQGSGTADAPHLVIRIDA
ncbi:MAG TPA: hypothetical protein VF576_04690, partial [Rubricoccaceae bacterium]